MLWPTICRPPDEDSDVMRVTRIPLRVMDGLGGRSNQTYHLVVTIKPMDTRAPIVTMNNGMFVTGVNSCTNLEP